MISFTKITLFVVCCSVVTDVTFGSRQSINDSAGGSGGGSNRRNNNKAVNTSSATSGPPPNPTGGATNIASNVGSTASNVGYNNGSGSGSGNNGGSSTGSNSASSSTSDNSGSMSNFGNHGTLADREADVSCHICNAVPDKSYDANVQVNVGEEMWSCGYLQETVQDVDPNSLFEDERNSCRQAQLSAEEQDCCAETMYINQPGADFHDPCFLCGNGSVHPDKGEALVNTGVVGSHTCSGLDMVMKERMFSANLCAIIIRNVASFCCNAGTSAGSSSFLRGARLGGLN